MNHHGLFTKLMKRNIPVQLLSVIEYWFRSCYTLVKWASSVSFFFKLECGVRQGGVISPFFFEIFIDDIIVNVVNVKSGCYINRACLSIILYADDMLLLAPSVESLQKLVTICSMELAALDMSINGKSLCVTHMRIGPRFNKHCANISIQDSQELNWVKSCRYLGVTVESASHFKCNITEAKKSFYRSFNAIFGRVGRIANENVTVELLIKKCLPTLLFAFEVCPLTKSDIRTLDYVVDSALKNIVDTNSNT
jgi:Reverse transcriptase (RNA-dependent DNA polymerase)